MTPSPLPRPLGSGRRTSFRFIRCAAGVQDPESREAGVGSGVSRDLRVGFPASTPHVPPPGGAGKYSHAGDRDTGGLEASTGHGELPRAPAPDGKGSSPGRRVMMREAPVDSTGNPCLASYHPSVHRGLTLASCGYQDDFCRGSPNERVCRTCPDGREVQCLVERTWIGQR